MIAAAAVVALGLAGPRVAHAQTKQQALVDRATLSVQEMMGFNGGGTLGQLLPQARAVMICPRVFRAGFILGGAGGGCVLLARGGNDSWSDPAFYGLSSGSIGPQAGIQDAEIVMVVLTSHGLNALLDSQFKVGADANITFLTLGAGIEGATTAAVGADIVAFSRSRGLFGGFAIGGSLLDSETRWNQAYYGQPLAARQVVIDMQANNPGADPLRAILMRDAAPPPAAPPPYAQAAATPREMPPARYAPGPAPGPGPAYAPAYRGSADPGPTALAPVQSQPLPPPR
ncbi:MAG TPA: lipid-binding SYLF domain-containing protein [Acetobacteraceae bacterium]|nr:lipid-binding SYLF domain-containing protein [Acetobacteraceae bacterium]